MSDVSSIIDLNDSDILKIEKVVQVLNTRQGERTNLDGFRREIIDRFAEAGFRVDVKTWDTNVVSLYAFDIEIQGRYEGKFDPDQMVHETTNDLLGLGTGGVIKTGGSGLWTPPSHTHVTKN